MNLQNDSMGPQHMVGMVHPDSEQYCKTLNPET